MVNIGREGVIDVLINLLFDSQYRSVNPAAKEALIRFTQWRPSLDFLTEKLLAQAKTPFQPARIAIITILGHVRKECPRQYDRVIHALLHAAQDPDYTVRYYAVESLRLCYDDSNQQEVIYERLLYLAKNDPTKAVREKAIKALAHEGHRLVHEIFQLRSEITRLRGHREGASFNTAPHAGVMFTLPPISTLQTEPTSLRHDQENNHMPYGRP